MSSNSLFEIELATPRYVKSDEKHKANGDEIEIKIQDPEKRIGQVFKYSKLVKENDLADSGKTKSTQEQEYRFRHVNTGRIMVDQEITFDGFKIRTLGLSPHIGIGRLAFFSDKHFELVKHEIEHLDEPENFVMEELLGGTPTSYDELDQRSRFRIISTSPSLDTRIKTNSCVQIQHIQSEMFLSYAQRISFAGKVKPPEEKKPATLQVPNLGATMGSALADMDDILFQVVDPDDIQNGTRDAVELKPERSNEDAFFLIPEKKGTLDSIFFI